MKIACMEGELLEFGQSQGGECTSGREREPRWQLSLQLQLPNLNGKNGKHHQQELHCHCEQQHRDQRGNQRRLFLLEMQSAEGECWWPDKCTDIYSSKAPNR